MPPPCYPLTCCSCKRNRWKSCKWTAEASGRSVLLPSGKEMMFRGGQPAVRRRSPPGDTWAPGHPAEPPTAAPRGQVWAGRREDKVTQRTPLTQKGAKRVLTPEPRRIRPRNPHPAAPSWYCRGRERRQDSRGQGGAGCGVHLGGGNAEELTPEPALRQERGLDEAPTLGRQGEPAGICETRARE